MSDAKGFDVKIVYVCVLNATESRDTLHDFISNGGWNCLSKWLEGFISDERHAAIRELLKCFQKLPITHRTLSTQVESKDLPGKMIRGLRKHTDEEIKSLAGSIYKSWMDMVDEGNKKKAKRKQEKADQTQTKKSKSEKSGPVCKFLIKMSLALRFPSLIQNQIIMEMSFSSPVNRPFSEPCDKAFYPLLRESSHLQNRFQNLYPIIFS